MPRPCKCRRITQTPRTNAFKPSGMPSSGLQRVILHLDELEALRLADLDGLYQDEGARRMGISRPTFGRLIAAARHKVADALLNGKVLVFQGGPITMIQVRQIKCAGCGHDFEAPFGTGHPEACPSCGAANFYRSDVGEHGNCHRHGFGGGRGGKSCGKGRRRGAPDQCPPASPTNSQEVRSS